MIQDPYRNIARFYDSFTEPSLAALRKVMLKMARPEDGMRVLEIGSGTGENLKLFKGLGCSVYGVDLSLSMTRVANKKLGDQGAVIFGDASKIPYSDNRFDLVLAMLTLHEMPESIRSPIINEMKRVAKSDGRLLIVDFHPGPIRFPKGWLYKLNILFFERLAGREHFKNHKSFLANKGLPPLLKASRLTVEKEKIVGGGNLALFSVKP